MTAVVSALVTVMKGLRSVLLETGLWLSIVGEEVDDAAVDEPGSVRPEGVSYRVAAGARVADESVLAMPMSAVEGVVLSEEVFAVTTGW